MTRKVLLRQPRGLASLSGIAIGFCVAALSWKALIDRDQVKLAYLLFLPVLVIGWRLSATMLWHIEVIYDGSELQLRDRVLGVVVRRMPLTEATVRDVYIAPGDSDALMLELRDGRKFMLAQGSGDRLERLKREIWGS